MTLAPGTDRLETARLVLRRVMPDDLPFFARLHALPVVVRYLYPEGPRSAEQTTAWLRSNLASYEEGGVGMLAVLRKDDGVLIGRCGLTELMVETATRECGLRKGWFGRHAVPPGLVVSVEHELSYTFDPAAWGHGFASEAASSVCDYAGTALRLPALVSVIHPENIRSRRLAERGGGALDGQIEVIGWTWDRFVWPLANPRRTVV